MPRKSAFFESRKEHWRRGGSWMEPEVVEFARRDVYAAEAAGVAWDPEEPELPEKIFVGQHGQPCCGVPTLYRAPDLLLLSPEGYEAAASAYNRERAGELVPLWQQNIDYKARSEEADGALHRLAHEAGVRDDGPDEIVSAVLEKMRHLRNEAITGAPAEKIRATERARCLAILDWLLSLIPQSWDWARRMTYAARTKVESGAVVLAGEPPPAKDGLQGALIHPDGQSCALCGKDWPHAHTEAQIREWEAHGGLRGETSPEPAPSVFPARVHLAATPRMRLLAEDPGAHDDRIFARTWRELTSAEWEEAARRWQDEPMLRARIGSAVAIARGMAGPTSLDKVERILTGKES